MVRIRLLAAAHATTHSRRTPLACSGLPSDPGRRAVAAWLPRRGCGGALVPVQGRRFHCVSDHSRLAYISPDILKFRHSFQITLPKCAVVLPVKGVRDDSYANWRSQVTSMYGGPLAFLFVVESDDDPAYPHIERLIREHADANIRLLVAGRTWYCSQKMHNQLHGFEAVLLTAAKYVILLDDDIHLHPGTIRYWVEEMESDPKVVVASGYTFDWVGPSVRHALLLPVPTYG